MQGQTDKKLPEIQTDITALYKNFTNLWAGLRNVAFCAATNATTPNAQTTTVVAAAKLIAKASGIFAVTVSAQANSQTTDSVSFTLKGFTDSVAGIPLTLSNVTQAGFGANGIALPGNTNVTNNGVFVSSTGAGITITGATGGFTIDAPPLVQGVANYYYSWSGISPANVGLPISVFPAGMTALFTLSVANSAAARAISGVTMSLMELPA